MSESNRAPGIGPCAGCGDSNPNLVCAECCTRLVADVYVKATSRECVDGIMACIGPDVPEDFMRPGRSSALGEYRCQSCEAVKLSERRDL